MLPCQKADPSQKIVQIEGTNVPYCRSIGNTAKAPLLMHAVSAKIC